MAMNENKLKALCVENSWLTCGTSEQHAKLLNMVNEFHTINSFATAIWVCSENVAIKDIETVLLKNL